MNISAGKIKMEQIVATNYTHFEHIQSDVIVAIKEAGISVPVMRIKYDIPDLNVTTIDGLKKVARWYLKNLDDHTVQAVYRIKPKPTEPQPSTEEIGEMIMDGDCWATDGCPIEPDGWCEHGYPSWLLQLGLI